MKKIKNKKVLYIIDLPKVAIGSVLIMAVHKQGSWILLHIKAIIL